MKKSQLIELLEEIEGDPHVLVIGGNEGSYSPTTTYMDLDGDIIIGP